MPLDDIVQNLPDAQVTIEDLDSDGDQDVLTGNLYGGSVSVRFNTGGTFGGGSDVAQGKYTGNLTTGDIDGDNDVDFLASITPAGLLALTGSLAGQPRERLQRIGTSVTFSPR